MTRYLQIAKDIADLIAGGTLRPGDALPSVRLAAERHKVSKGTVIQAYSVLEARRLIEARPQSGYYVRPTSPSAGQVPRAGLAQPNLVRSGERERIRDTLGDLVGSRATSLGSSFPDPSLFPLEALNRALGSSARKSSYANTLADLQLGLPELRRVIAQRYLELGYVVPMEEIIITCGGMEAISLSLQVVTRPGDLVLIESPTFFSGLQLIEQLGLHALEMPTDAVQGIDLAGLDKALKAHKVAACMLMTNCQNPLGFTLEEQKKRALVALLARHGIPLVENDVYTEMQFGFSHQRAAKAFDERGLVLHCGSFTKCLAPGFKIGWVAPGRFHEAILHRKFATTLGTSVPPQAAIAQYIRDHSYEKHLRQLRRTLLERLNKLSAAIMEHFPEGTRLTRPQGGNVLWVQMPDAVSSQAVFELASVREIGIAPGSVFSPRGEYSNFMRVNFSHPWSAALERTVHWLGQTVSGMC